MSKNPPTESEAINDDISKMLSKRPKFSHLAVEIYSIVRRWVIKTEIAFGGCRICYGKGYSTVQTMEMKRMKFCSCSRGTQLLEMIRKKI